MEPIFTVIITTYNRKDMLPRAIQSVLSQTLPYFELLLIDNGSTDDTQSLVSTIKDPRVIFFRNPRPTDSCDGPRNLGIKMAKGRLISFLDDDDTWYPERLKKVNRAFQEHPEVSLVCHSEHRIVNGKIDGTLRYGPWTEDIYERLLYEGNCLSSCGSTIKSGVLRELNGFDLRKEFSGAADYELWIRMAGMGMKFYFIDEPLGSFSLTGQNYSVRDAAFGLKVASIVKWHILEREKKRLWGISKRGMRRLLKLYAIAGKQYLVSRFGHGSK